MGNVEVAFLPRWVIQGGLLAVDEAEVVMTLSLVLAAVQLASARPLDATDGGVLGAGNGEIEAGWVSGALPVGAGVGVTDRMDLMIAGAVSASDPSPQAGVKVLLVDNLALETAVDLPTGGVSAVVAATLPWSAVHVHLNGGLMTPAVPVARVALHVAPDTRIGWVSEACLQGESVLRTGLVGGVSDALTLDLAGSWSWPAGLGAQAGLTLSL